MTIEGRRTKSVLMHKLGVHPFAAAGHAAGLSRHGPQPLDELPDFMRDSVSIGKSRPSEPHVDIREVQQKIAGGHIVITDMNKYFDDTRENPHTNCISCSKCLPIKNKLV